MQRPSHSSEGAGGIWLISQFSRWQYNFSRFRPMRFAIFHDVESSCRTWRQSPTAACDDGTWESRFPVSDSMVGSMQHFSMMIDAADSMQCVAVIGLSLKLPNLCLYFWATTHIPRVELAHIAMTSCLQARSDSLSLLFCCDCRSAGLLASWLAGLLLRKGTQSKMYTVWYTMHKV